MELIKVIGLSKTYGTGEVMVEAIRDISIGLEERQFVVVLGPSGSGKSTFLNIIGGMDKPTQGKVYFRGTEISSLNDKELTEYRREKIGFVFQFYNLISNLTALENVQLASELSPQPLDAAEVIDSIGLGSRSSHFPSQMSGGEQQRVAIARAVVKNPDLLLCDEPTGALDYTTGKEVLKVLRRVHEDYNKAVVIITHNAAIAEIADRVIRLSSGRIAEDRINETPVGVEGIKW